MFSNEQLQALTEGRIVGNTYPYDTNNEQEIEAHIRQLLYRINRIPNLVCESEWNHFGSGYASFVEFFCYRQEDVTVVEEKYGFQEIKTNGIIIDICRLAPVAIMGEDDRYKKIRIETNEVVGGAYGTLLDGANRLVFNEKFQRIAEQLKQSLKEFDYGLLEAEKLNQSLSFKTKIPTIYRKPNQYIVMDAIFYWED
ncbi:hypothetical protein BKP37_06370 [Anaerobacillus alkalilacustris]|uniref:Uncharacterized protein n=1 Tax=Anaerobacillus alkalilacustris TaxID=393763 RepID=A0A1S2LY64_9BACI|nr:hypothetical protein [Anaerobacillus alkalilacustris]OIJ16345.1 hypothetical protein BKP37_06370 [Anaerobacillus alkalilacustris]